MKSIWKVQQRDPADYEKDRVDKYAEYFKEWNFAHPRDRPKIGTQDPLANRNRPQNKTAVGLKKEGFEDLLRKAGVPCQYFCRRSFATWDVLLPLQGTGCQSGGKQYYDKASSTSATTSASSVTKTVARKKAKTRTTTQVIPMDTSVNLKRRRDSGEGASKKMCSGPSHPNDPLEGPSYRSPQSQPSPTASSTVATTPTFTSPSTFSISSSPLPPPSPPQFCISKQAPPKQQPSQPPQS